MKKKILILANSQLTIESFLIPLIKKLKKKYKIVIISKFFSKKNFLLKDIETYNLDLKREIKILDDLKNLLKINKFIKNNNFDLIFTITPKSGLLGMLSGFFNKTKVRIHIFTGQVWANKSSFFKYFLKFFDKLIIYLSTDILCDGINQKKFLFQNGFKENIKVIENGSICGVDIKKFKPDNKIKKKYRKKFKIKKNEIVFVYAGRISKDKGIDSLKKVFLLLKKSKYKIHFFLLGNDETNNFKKSIKDIKNLHHINHSKHLNEFFQFADVYITSTYREGFGISVAQAMSSNLPVIAPNIYGLKDILKNNVNSLIYNIDDIKKLYSCCVILIKNKEKRDLLGSCGRKMIENKFQQNKVVSGFENYFFNRLD